jgi:sulfonate transport system ATP-binding protein
MTHAGRRSHTARAAVALVYEHDVDEALLLADRVVVLSDGVVSLDLPVALSPPRVRTQPDFAAQRTRLLLALGVVELGAM